MRTHLIDGNTIVNTIMASPDEAASAFPEFYCIEATGGAVGWAYVNGDFFPPSTETPVNIEITPRQIRMALTRLGLRQAVENAVAAGGQDLRDWWEYSTVFERNHPQVMEMAAALNVDAQQVDSLWILGASL